MATKLIYMRVQLSKDSEESAKLRLGTYEPPEGWRVHSMAISESRDSYAGYIHLLLEASVDTDRHPYRG
jgi:hypothetical protein